MAGELRARVDSRAEAAVGFPAVHDHLATRLIRQRRRVIDDYELYLPRGGMVEQLSHQTIGHRRVAVMRDNHGDGRFGHSPYPRTACFRHPPFAQSCSFTQASRGVLLPEPQRSGTIGACASWLEP